MRAGMRTKNEFSNLKWRGSSSSPPQGPRAGCPCTLRAQVLDVCLSRRSRGIVAASPTQGSSRRPCSCVLSLSLSLPFTNVQSSKSVLPQFNPPLVSRQPAPLAMLCVRREEVFEEVVSALYRRATGQPASSPSRRPSSRRDVIPIRCPGASPDKVKTRML